MEMVRAPRALEPPPVLVLQNSKVFLDKVIFGDLATTEHLEMRHGAGRPRKRALESLATESPKRSFGIEPVGQGQTPHGTAGASGSQILTVPSLEVLTPIVPIETTLTVFTVPPAVPPVEYPTPPPAVPAAVYHAPPPAVPTAYPVPSPLVPATAYSTPAPVVPVDPAVPVALAYIFPTVPPAVPSPAYATALGVPSPAYPAAQLVVPALVVSPVLAASSTHSTDIIVARAWIPILVESVKR
ncbi:proline-rich receptor-like protein kinase PERK2 [Zingiber officinale]|uniref:proline-rich receptor-like protein kinase PERK2 n=1 Tax=Zingiber officinale TaxID=94328 RepID=UPI001C4CE263|nr:proline-rich receptor-like protein kinase PERK2 [Zingiber officinale]